MEYLTKTGWGGVATVTAKELLDNREEWRQNLYSRKMLVLKGLSNLSKEEYWNLHTVWGQPWGDEDYKTTLEKYEDIGNKRFITAYGNLITKKSIGNMEMPWHRDIPWHREKRYPIRSLYPVSMTLGAGATGTRFCDCDQIFSLLSYENQKLLVNTELEIQSWYQFQRGVKTPDRKWIPLVEIHPGTNRRSILLNSFGPTHQDLKYSTAPGGTWILDVRQKNGSSYSQNEAARWLNFLHGVAITEDNCYMHNWEMGDLLLFDNYSGVFHSRGRVVAEENAERLFWRMNLRHSWQTD
jgi:alpha-ketoglutarate-dependent taurine dioxygenase